jgi:hypothetical protein
MADTCSTSLRVTHFKIFERGYAVAGTKSEFNTSFKTIVRLLLVVKFDSIPKLTTPPLPEEDVVVDKDEESNRGP